MHAAIRCLAVWLTDTDLKVRASLGDNLGELWRLPVLLPMRLSSLLLSKPPTLKLRLQTAQSLSVL